MALLSWPWTAAMFGENLAMRECWRARAVRWVQAVHRAAYSEPVRVAVHLGHGALIECWICLLISYSVGG